MFPNMLNHTTLYQTMMRSPLSQHSHATSLGGGSASFLMENLLRERAAAAIMPRPQHHPALSPIGLGMSVSSLSQGHMSPSSGHSSPGSDRSHEPLKTLLIPVSSPLTSSSSPPLPAVQVVSASAAGRPSSVSTASGNANSDTLSYSSHQAPFLKFGMNAILGTDNNRKSPQGGTGKFVYMCVVYLPKQTKNPPQRNLSTTAMVVDLMFQFEASVSLLLIG